MMPSSHPQNNTGPETGAGTAVGQPLVIAACLGRRYSGINASLIAVLPELARHIPVAALGFHLPPTVPRIGWRELRRLARAGRSHPADRADGSAREQRWLVWHARRNVDMVAGIFLRRFAGYRLRLVFTSVAQRRHTWFTRFCIRQMDAVIAPTAAAAAFLERPATIVPHGVDTGRFRPPADRAAAWAARGLPGRYGIGVFGRLRPGKGTGDFVAALLRVLPERPDWTAVLVGQTTPEQRPFAGRLRERLRAAGLADRCRFIGFLPDPEALPDWYRALSVVVCPSRTEGFGLPCLEAMASGCPVVATRTGAWPELIEEGADGFLVPGGEPAALAAAIAKITADPAAVAAMGARARAKVERRYRIADEAAGLAAAYRRLLAGAPGGESV